MQAQLGSMFEEYRAMRSRVELLSARLAAMTASAQSVDRSVTATVGPQGELVALSIDATIATRLDLKTLAARILEASALAATQIRERLRVEMCEVLPHHLRHLLGPDGTVNVSGLLPGDPAGLGPMRGVQR
jgi:DNA-binding protein YbaB